MTNMSANSSNLFLSIYSTLSRSKTKQTMERNNLKAWFTLHFPTWPAVRGNHLKVVDPMSPQPGQCNAANMPPAANGPCLNRPDMHRPKQCRRARRVSRHDGRHIRRSHGWLAWLGGDERHEENLALEGPEPMAHDSKHFRSERVFTQQ